MTITVTTTSQKLSNLLSSSDLSLIKDNCGKCEPESRYSIFLRNIGSNDVYVELYKDATSTDGVKIVGTSGELSFTVDDLSKVNLISAAGNSDVRVLITV